MSLLSIINWILNILWKKIKILTKKCFAAKRSWTYDFSLTYPTPSQLSYTLLSYQNYWNSSSRRKAVVKILET